MCPVSATDGPHGVPELERTPGAVEQQKPGQATEQANC